MRQASKHARNRIWRDGQRCQRLFKAVGWPAYIGVETSAEATNIEDICQRVKADREHRRKEREAALAEQRIKEGIRSQADPWLTLTEWVPHLQDLPRAALLRARQPPGAEIGAHGEEEGASDDTGLRDVCKAMERLIRKAFESSRPEVVGRVTLEIIERREAGAESNERPFYARHRVSTVKKYSQKLVSILCYLWRTHDQAERPPYQLTGKQDALLQLLGQTARSQDVAKKERLEEGCLHLWIALLDHTLLDDEHKSALLSGVA
ncbi:hypothetical protein DM02DRAFT_540007, partial [Periconia macrospinosa]